MTDYYNIYNFNKEELLKYKYMLQDAYMDASSELIKAELLKMMDFIEGAEEVEKPTHVGRILHECSIAHEPTTVTATYMIVRSAIMLYCTRNKLLEEIKEA